MSLHLLKKLVPCRTIAPGNQIPSLDGVRGLAVLFVLLDHLSDARLTLFPAISFNKAGGYGVFLFFSLSAFLLTYLMCQQPRERLIGARYWLEYAMRRALRIFPLFIVVLFATDYFENQFALKDLVNHVLLRDGQWHLWTIPVEVKYYFILPLLVMTVIGFQTAATRTKWVALAVMIALIWGLLFPLEKLWSLTDEIWLQEYIIVFALGSAAGAAHAFIQRRKLDLSRFAIAFDVVAYLALLSIVLRIPGVFNYIFEPEVLVKNFRDNKDTAAVTWAVFLFCTLQGRGFMRLLMQFPLLRYLGIISYSAYLWHRIVLHSIEDLRFSPSQEFLLFFAAIIAVATTSYLVFELPLSKVRLKRHIHGMTATSSRKP